MNTNSGFMLSSYLMLIRHMGHNYVNIYCRIHLALDFNICCGLISSIEFPDIVVFISETARNEKLSALQFLPSNN